MAALLAAVVVLGAAIRLIDLSAPISRSPDEATYTMQANALAKDGFTGSRAVVQEYFKSPEEQLNPPPTRIGFYSLVALSMKISGIHDERAGAYVACWASILALAAGIWTGWRFWGFGPALFGGLFLALFPPDLVIARRCWSDALVGLVGILMMYLTMEIFSGRERWFFYIPLVLVGSAAALVKETSILIYAPCLAITLWALARKRDYRAAGLVLGMAAACTLLAIGLLAIFTGNIRFPVTMVLTGAHTNTFNTYALNFQSGPGYLLLWGFGALSPITAILAVIGVAVGVVNSRDRSRSGIVLLSCLTVTLLIIFMLVPLWLNLRYVSASYAPICLFAGSALWWMLTTVNRKLPFAGTGLSTLALALVALSMFADHQRFEKAFVRITANDLSVGVIRDALKLSSQQ